MILIFLSKNAFWNQSKFLKNDSAKLFVKSLITIAGQVFTVKDYKKEICRILGSEWIKIRNIAHKNLLFSVTTYSLSTSKVTNKGQKIVLFVNESFNLSLFSHVTRVKNSMPISFPRSFWLVNMWKYATKQVLLHIKNWKTSGNEIT